MWDEVRKMQEAGLRWVDISYALQRSDRYLRMLKQRYEPRTFTIPIAKDRETYTGTELDWNLNAFEAFFNRFSPYEMQPHQRPWIQAFLEHRNLILNVPPRHSKSTLFAVWLPIWLICRDRDVQIIIVSAANEDASKWAMEIAAQLELNMDLVTTFGQFMPENKGDFPWRPTKGEFVVQGRTKYMRGAQFTLQVKGMTQHILGREADYVIVDDGINPEIAANELTRKKNLDHLQQSVLTRIESSRNRPNGGRACLVGQRVHSQDYYGVLENMVYEKGNRTGDKIWHVERYPAILKWPEAKDGSDAETLWPDRWPYEELMEQYARVGGHATFSTMYQQEPLPQEGALVKQVWWESCKDKSRDGYIGIRRTKGDPLIARVCAVDPSPTNFHGIIVGDLYHGEDGKEFRFVLMEAFHLRSELPELRAAVRRIHAQHDLDYLVWEDSTFSKWFFEDPWFHEVRNEFKVVRHKTHANKHDAEYGLQSMAWDFEDRHISLPYGDAEGRRMTDGLGSEVLAYGEYPTDDMFMALWFIKFNYRRMKPIPRYSSAKVYNNQGGEWSWWGDMKQQEPVRRQFDSRRVLAG